MRFVGRSDIQMCLTLAGWGENPTPEVAEGLGSSSRAVVHVGGEAEGVEVEGGVGEEEEEAIGVGVEEAGDVAAVVVESSQLPTRRPAASWSAPTTRG